MLLREENLGKRRAVRTLELWETSCVYFEPEKVLCIAAGTLLLSEILTELGASPLEDTAIKSLSNFYSSRLVSWQLPHLRMPVYD